MKGKVVLVKTDVLLRRRNPVTGMLSIVKYTSVSPNKSVKPYLSHSSSNLELHQLLLSRAPDESKSDLTNSP